jgi:hypothetical protein
MSDLNVGPIQSYVQGSTWFDLTRYSDLGKQERVSVNLIESNLWLIDSSQLFILNDYAPRIAFINEGAGYQSPITLTASGATSGSVTVFENLSGSNSILPSRNAPLQLGDWVQLSTISGGTQLQLSVTPNGVFNPGASPLSTDASLNPTYPQNPNSPVFWVAYADPQATNPLLILGYEDIAGGGDNDFNDGLLAIDLGADNLNEILNTAYLGQNPNVNLAQIQPVDYDGPTAVPFELESSVGLIAVMSLLGLRYLRRHWQQLSL